MSSIALQAHAGREARQPWVRAALFAGALVVSLALHGLLLVDIPLVPVGRPSASSLRTVQPLVMGEVRPLPDLSNLTQPAVFHPEDPNAFREVDARQQDLLEDLRAGAEAIPFEFDSPAGPAAPPPIPEAAAAFDLRREILQIEQRAAAAELESLPRRVAPALPRTAEAPDVTLPADAEAIAAASAAARTGAAFPSVGFQPTALPDPGAMMDAASTAEPTETQRLSEQAALIREAPADVTDIEPIERLLAVNVTTFRATDENALYFEFAITRAGTEALPVLPKDVLLIQDCSESITRTKLEFFKDGLVDYLRTLTTVDRFNIMRYSDTPVLCFDDWQPATAESLTAGARFVEAMRARGQTDLFTPLQRVLSLHPPGGRPMIAVLMTDGRPTMGAIDSSEIIARFSRANAGRISVFTVGAGTRVNTFLLDLLGHNNRGGSWIMPLREEIPDAVRRTARELSRPVLANLEYRFSGDSAAEVYPGTLTHLYLDRPLRLVGRAPLHQQTAVLQIVGESGPQRRDMVFTLDLALAADGGEGIRREWVAQKIYKLINDHLISGRDEILHEIRDLSRRHNVPLPYGVDFPL